MIDPSFETMTASDPTHDALREGLEEATTDRDFWKLRADRLMNQINTFEHYLRENPFELDEAALTEMADIFDITLTKEYDVEITVRFNGTVTVPHDFDMDNLDQYITASMDFYGYIDISNDYIEESEISVDWTEN